MRTANQAVVVVGWLALSMLLSACEREVALSDDEQHRLYAAALAASDAPLDSDLFKKVCRKINVFDEAGTPNDKYMSFISDHVRWTMKLESESFKQEISTREKAQNYIRKRL